MLTELTSLPRRAGQHANEYAHNLAALFHEQIAAAHERAANILHAFGDDERCKRHRDIAARESGAADRAHAAAQAVRESEPGS